MKLVVTGALGHIGSYVIRDLAIQFPGAQIVMVDNMMTQRYPSLFNLPASGNYHFIEDDVTTMDLNPVFENAYAVIHLAAITDASGSYGNAEQIEENNYQATLKIAQACVDNDVRLIAPSSTSVYGTESKHVYEDGPESDLNPQSPYATVKLKEEKLLEKYRNEEGLKAISCRFGTIFGASPGMRFHTAVNKFCWQAAMGQAITVWRTAYDQVRPYLALSDASRAITFFLHNDHFDEQIYNILTHNTTVRHVVDVIKEYAPDLEVSFVDNKIMNDYSYEVSCQRIITKGFTFAGDLRGGIGDTISRLKQANSI